MARKPARRRGDSGSAPEEMKEFGWFPQNVSRRTGVSTNPISFLSPVYPSLFANSNFYRLRRLRFLGRYLAVSGFWVSAVQPLVIQFLEYPPEMATPNSASACHLPNSYLQEALYEKSEKDGEEDGVRYRPKALNTNRLLDLLLGYFLYLRGSIIPVNSAFQKPSDMCLSIARHFGS